MDHDRYQVSVYLFRLQFRSAPSRDPYFSNGDGGAQPTKTSLCVQILTHGVLGAFQLQLGQGLLDHCSSQWLYSQADISESRAAHKNDIR